MAYSSQLLRRAACAAVAASLALGLGITAPERAAAQTALGAAVGVTQNATARRGGRTVQLAAGAPLFEGDRIRTNGSGQVEILFSDDTKMVVGPNSNLEIAQYLMRNQRTASRMAVNALGGSFRFISGNSDSSAYQVGTPTGTIGVRGTKFDFAVSPRDGTVAVMQLQGASQLCPAGAARNDPRCGALRNRCKFGVIGRRGPLGRSRAEALENGEFPFLLRQDRLRREFRVPFAEDCASPVKAEAIPRVAPPPPPPPPEPEPEKSITRTVSTPNTTTTITTSPSSSTVTSTTSGGVTSTTTVTYD